MRSAAAVADAADLSVALGGRATLGLGVAARLQLASAIPRLAIGNECVAHDLHDDILTAPLVASDGMLTVPAEPGLGVTVDRGQLERWQASSDARRTSRPEIDTRDQFPTRARPDWPRRVPRRSARRRGGSRRPDATSRRPPAD